MSRFTNKSSGATAEGAGLLVFVRPADLSRAEFIGPLVEGEFAGTLPNQFNEEKDDFKIIADEPTTFSGKDKDGNDYTTEINVGDTVIVNGAGNLGYHISRSKIGPGDLCKINYLGKNEINEGKRAGVMAHNFEVEY